jgi:hypothetical protein
MGIKGESREESNEDYSTDYYEECCVKIYSLAFLQLFKLLIKLR